YMPNFQMAFTDTHLLPAGMNATYYLTPETACYYGNYMATYDGWDTGGAGPLQEWKIGRFYPFPQVPPQKGDTGNLAFGDFSFAPYLPSLTIKVSPVTSVPVSLGGAIWSGLSWPHLQLIQEDHSLPLSPYPKIRIPYYDLFVDGIEVASGPLGQLDGTQYYGRWWDNVSESWNVSGSRGLLRVHMPSLATISNWSTYEVNFNLGNHASIQPFIRSLVLPSNYSTGEKIILNVVPADGITIMTVEYSFNKGATWRAAEKTPAGYPLIAGAADQLDIRITGTDANGNIYKYTSPAAALSGQVKLSVAPQSVAGTPGQTVEIKGRLTTIEGTGLKGLAVSLSDGNNLQYTSPDESGNFSFAYQITTVPQDLVITSAAAGVYKAESVHVLISGANAAVPVSTSLGMVNFTTSSGTITDLINVPPDGMQCPADGLIFPYGMFSYNIEGLAPSATAYVTITTPTPIPMGSTVFKCQNGNLVDFSQFAQQPDPNTFILTLKDGGQGDADGVANGTIVDPCGMAFADTSRHRSSSAQIPRVQGPAPIANVVIQSASLSAAKVAAGAMVTITAEVANKGTADGITQIKLYVNGEEEAHQGVSVKSGGAKSVVFTVSRDEPGRYTVYVGSVSAGSFTVDEFVNPDLILYISLLLLLLALILGAAYIVRTRLQEY
ncbi:MAG: choice-of-anchor U domain-containing protein, partial [Dehalococcoidia bacterium]